MSQFRCTPAGAVARSRRRIAFLLLGLAVPMLLLALWMVMERRWVAAGLSLGSSVLAWFCWRMSGDLDPFWLEISESHLGVQMRRRLETLALENPRVRRLSAAEVTHLHRLTSTAGMIFASAGFDSHRLGVCNLFATHLDNAVLVEVDDPDEEGGQIRWIVTPDDPESFLGALESVIGVSRPEPSP